MYIVFLIIIALAVLVFVICNFYTLFWSLIANIMGFAFILLGGWFCAKILEKANHGFGVFISFLVLIAIVIIGLCVMEHVIPYSIMETLYGSE